MRFVVVNIKYCHLEVCSVLQRSLRVKPCAKEVCGPNKALTTHAIPMKTVAFVTEELGGKRFFFHVYQSTGGNPFPFACRHAPRWRMCCTGAWDPHPKTHLCSCVLKLRPLLATMTWFLAALGHDITGPPLSRDHELFIFNQHGVMTKGS